MSTLRGQRVTIPFGVTPGTQLKYGVSLNCKEVFSCLSALDGQLTYSEGPIEDLARCTKMMQVTDFYSSVQRLVGTQNPAQMQSFFEPTSVRYVKNEGLLHSKKYRNYCRGKYLPSRKTLELMSKATGHDWLHHLSELPWSVFDTKTPVLPHEMFIRELDRNDTHALSSSVYECRKGGRAEVFEDNCRGLLYRPGMPALLALVLILRIAHEKGNQRAATLVVGFLATKLIVMGAELQQRGIASLLFRLAVHHLFPLAEECRFEFSARDMVRNSMFLNLTPFFHNDVDPTRRIDQAAREALMCEWHQMTTLLRRFASEGPGPILPRPTLLSPRPSLKKPSPFD